MKSFLKSLLAGMLALLARGIIAKYRPMIVMVTGSVGKTSTKDAVASVLGKDFFLRASEKSYNSEFGVPLTIIGAENPWENPAAWFRVFQEALALILLPSHYPKLLVLEVGADRPGDLARILKFVTPDAVVVTRLPEVPVHVEAYTGPQAVRDEEFGPAYALPEGAPLVYSADDTYTAGMAARLQLARMTFGFSEDADVRLSDPSFFDEEQACGMQALVTVRGKEARIRVEGALGRPQLYAPAAALAMGLSLGLSLADALKGVAAYVPPSGRARILRGIKGSRIVDDTYNSSPTAVEELLDAASLMGKRGRRVVILGDMLELGRYSIHEHERIGMLAAKGADLFITVGIRARAMRDAALAAGFPGDGSYSFDTSREAAEAVPALIEEKDMILVKGSQSIRMERIVEALLDDPADHLKLVRQEKEWKRR